MKSFGRIFVQVFGLKAPFQTDQHLEFAKYALSNLFAGLGYFHGTSQVDTSKKAIYAETTAKFWEKSEEARKHSTPEIRGPYELLTHTPSRAVFPRGFLWDEGFHLLSVLEWDADLAVEVIRSWLSLMDDDGWIGREQVVGAEAESATPADAITQFPHIANPPTLFLAVSKFIELLKGDKKYYGHESWYLVKSGAGKMFLTEIYPLLKKHYEWFRKSQSGDVEAHSVPSANLNEGYRWRGRTPETNVASGLDDYPRAEPPDITELHLDALCWVGVMSRVLEKTAFFTGSTHDAFKYQDHTRAIKKNIDTLHWNPTENLYCDTIVHDDTHTYVCHRGYLSLFPLLTGFLHAAHPSLPAVLSLLRDPSHLWTPHGIRSLSPSSKKYGVGENFWRSPIWININFLLLQNLLILAQTPGPEQARAKEIYTELRVNVVNTVFESWKDSGYLWEQYDPAGGHGQRTQHFTGWTALVVQIMAMPDLSGGQGYREKVKEYYEDVKVRGDVRGGKAVGLAVVGMAFVYVTRRRFAGTLRDWRRR